MTLPKKIQDGWARHRKKILVAVAIIAVIILVWLLHSCSGSSNNRSPTPQINYATNSPPDSDNPNLYFEVGEINARTLAIQQEIETTHQSEALRLEAICEEIDKLNDQVSKISGTGITSNTLQELQDMKKSIALLQQQLTDLKSSIENKKPTPIIIKNISPDPQKQIGLLNINSH